MLLGQRFHGSAFTAALSWQRFHGSAFRVSPKALPLRRYYESTEVKAMSQKHC